MGFVDFFPMGWILFALCIVGVAFVLFNSKRRKMADADLGEVSNQWIAEYRLGRGNGDGRH